MSHAANGNGRQEANGNGKERQDASRGSSVRKAINVTHWRPKVFDFLFYDGPKMPADIRREFDLSRGEVFHLLDHEWFMRCGDGQYGVAMQWRERRRPLAMPFSKWAEQSRRFRQHHRRM